MTQPMEDNETFDELMTARTAFVMPVVTSGVVGALWEAMMETGSREIRTASVFVPDHLDCQLAMPSWIAVNTHLRRLPRGDIADP